jgi:fructose-1,6-bisphosphatase/inositol monophosphatase family enzyme
MLVVECPHCEEVFKGQRGLAMHCNHQPDCLKAYLQLSISSKNQKMTGNPRTHHQKERHDTERRNKKVRVDSSIKKEKLSKKTNNQLPQQ